MADLITPISPSQWVVQEGNRVHLTCVSPKNPRYFYDTGNVLQPISLSSMELVATNIGDCVVKSRNTRSVGVRVDGSFDKLIGFRPSNIQDGSIQLELSLKDSDICGEKIAKLKNASPLSNGFDFGGLRFRADRYCGRILVPITKKLTGFEMVFTVDYTGLERRGFEFYDEKGIFQFKFDHPKIFTAAGEQYDLPFNFDEAMGHEIVDVSPGVCEYRKFITKRIKDLDLAQEDLLIDATVNYGSETYDGYVRNEDIDWASCRGASSGDSVNTSDSSIRVNVKRWNPGVETWQITRGYLFFDTSGIPDGATIISASAHYYCNSGNSYVHMEKHTAGTTLAVSDFANAKFGYDYGSGFSSSTGWKNYTFVGGELSDISKTGVTKISLRELDYDVDNDAPPAATEAYQIVTTGGEANEPYLTVTAASLRVLGVFPPTKVCGVTSPAKVLGKTF